MSSLNDNKASRQQLYVAGHLSRAAEPQERASPGLSKCNSVTLTLTPAELVVLTGGLTQPRRQVDELRRHGFWRARLGRDNQVILERAHYEAVCAGALRPGVVSTDTVRPQVRAVLESV